MACKVNPYPRGPFSIMIGGRRQSDNVFPLLRLPGERGGVRERGDPGGLLM